MDSPPNRRTFALLLLGVAAFTVYGDRAKLDEWRRTDEFEAWVFRAQNCFDQLGVVPGVTYAASSETMARRARALGR